MGISDLNGMFKGPGPDNKLKRNIECCKIAKITLRCLKMSMLMISAIFEMLLNSIGSALVFTFFLELFLSSSYIIKVQSRR